MSFQSKWREKAQKTKEEAEKRKADRDAGIATENTWAKRRNTNPNTKRTSVAIKKNIQSISAADLSWAEVKIAVPNPVALKPEDLRITYNESGKEIKPPEPAPMFANVTSASGSPFVIGLHGGGTIPVPYGVTCKENGDYAINLIVETSDEARKLAKFSDEAQAALLIFARQVYGPCFVPHDDLVVRLYTKPMPKKNKSNELWPSKLPMTIKWKDFESHDVSLVKDDKTPISIVTHLEGMFWKDVKVHLSCVMFGWKWCDKRNVYLPQIRFLSKLLGTAVMTENPEHAHLVYPSQAEEHEAQHCIRKHHTPVDILCAPSAADLVFKEPVANKSGTGGKVVEIENKDGTTLILKFTRGGVLPSYAVNQNLAGKDTLTMQFDDEKEFAACDQFNANILNYLLENRSKYFAADKSEELIRGCFKPLLKPASATSGNTQCRLITAGVNIGGNGTSCMLVDEHDQLLTDPEALVNCRFTELWISIFMIYLNSGETGFTKRLTYLKRAPAKITYTVDEEQPTQQPVF